MKPKLSKPRPKQDTAQRIRAAADELFCGRGFAAVSVQDIAHQARVQKALVFYHFGSKEALFEQILEGYYQAHRDALATAYAGAGTVRERLHRMIDAYLTFMADHARYAALIQQQVGSPETHPLIERNLAPLFTWIEQALAELTPASGPLAPRHFFLTFSGTVINYFTYAPLLAPLWGSDPTAAAALDERRRHVHWLVDTVLDALTAARPPRPRSGQSSRG
ncbi:MAG: TetR/AcrR family transcriptional regulator [Deltaproteobacteria bacterium]|nr:TetR/AcrR family transcriptional regulator [Deltaproteobacteria bacterium]